MKETAKTCETCMNLIAAGGGDHLCTEGEEPKLVIDDYFPTEDYLWCGGAFYEND